MDQARWARAAGLFDSLCELDPPERARQLDRLAVEDAGLAAELRAMLEADVDASPLDRGIGDLLPRLFGKDENAAAERSGRIGAWQLHERIGRGGMGEVYRATRADGGFEQQAAVKLLKRGMDSEQILRRFLRERRILAGLHHPNIAQLHDGGITNDGLPWFAMELVDGQPITDYCEQEGCSLERKLDLVVAVCHAVDFAHRNLVVHRDLKPANVLVDAAGDVKLLDFGIAKLLDDSTDGLQTETGMRVLTPAYAAPEQVRGEAVTTATDVHALGLLLYELLTGQLPPEQLRAQATPAVTVTRPSLVLRRSTASGRPLARRTLKAIEGDLDTIVVTALHRDPARRYRGAAALADDLQRLRSGRPVAARRDNAWYRTRKFVARNIALVSLGSLLLLALVAGLWSALWQADRARDQARLAQAQAERADRSRAFLVSVFNDTSPFSTPKGATLTAAELLQSAAGRVNSELGAYPSEQAELRIAIGTSLLALGEFGHARTLLGEAIAQLREQPVVDHRMLVGALQHYTQLAADSGELAVAGDAAAEALSLLERQQDDDARLRRVQLRTSLAKLANLRGDTGAALVQYRQILDERVVLFGSEDDPRLSVDWNNLANTYLRSHEYAESAAAFRRAGELLAAADGYRQPRMLWVETGLAVALMGAGDNAAAAAAFDRATDLGGLLPDDHHMLGALASARSLLLRRQGDYRGAADEAVRAVEILGRIDHVSLPHAYFNLGMALLYLDRPGEAATPIARAEAGFLEDGGASPRTLLARVAHGAALVLDGKPAGAERVRAALQDLSEAGAPAAIELGEAHILMAHVAQVRGDSAAAAAHRDQAASLFSARWGDAHPRVRALRTGNGAGG